VKGTGLVRACLISFRGDPEQRHSTPKTPNPAAEMRAAQCWECSTPFNAIAGSAPGRYAAATASSAAALVRRGGDQTTWGIEDLGEQDHVGIAQIAQGLRVEARVVLIGCLPARLTASA
jgi:hypothetical protein